MHQHQHRLGHGGRDAGADAGERRGLEGIVHQRAGGAVGQQQAHPAVVHGVVTRVGDVVLVAEAEAHQHRRTGGERRTRGRAGVEHAAAIDQRAQRKRRGRPGGGDPHEGFGGHDARRAGDRAAPERPRCGPVHGRPQRRRPARLRRTQARRHDHRPRHRHGPGHAAPLRHRRRTRHARTHRRFRAAEEGAGDPRSRRSGMPRRHARPGRARARLRPGLRRPVGEDRRRAPSRRCVRHRRTSASPGCAGWEYGSRAGGALAMASTPMLPPPPGLLSTITVVLVCSPTDWASARASWSVALPAAKGTMKVTGFSG